MMYKKNIHIRFFFITLFIIITHYCIGIEKQSRPAEWAAPLKLKGVNNLYKINDNLYRSAQPKKDGIIYLKKMGIKTIINLRSFHSDDDEITTSGLLIKRIKMNAWDIKDEDVIAVLKLLKNEKGAPYLIHCQSGSDRTGVIIAFYRIVMQGWSKKKAIDEMINGGYGFHKIWKNIPKYIEKADIEKIKKSLD